MWSCFQFDFLSVPEYLFWAAHHKHMHIMAARGALLCVALLSMVRHSAAGYREQVAHAEKRQ
jgi:hypothetical protein